MVENVNMKSYQSKKGKRFYGFIFDFEFGEFEFYTFDLSPNYDSNFTESVVYTCDKVEPF